MTDTTTTNATATVNGVIGGMQTGYDWQLANWLAGIEADIQFVDRGASPTFVCPAATCNPFGPVGASLDQGFKMQWFATLRGRFGATMTPDALLYVTGGPAFAEFIPSGTISSFDPAGAPAIEPFYLLQTKVGWAAGAGIEARLGGSWSAKIEYLHLDFGKVSSRALNDLAVPLINVDFNARIRQDLVRLGLNYRFDSIGAAAVRH